MVAVLLLIADFIRTIARPISPRLYRPDPRLGWTMSPGVRKFLSTRTKDGQLVWENDITINSHGFNDRHFSEEKRARNRVLVIGDSIVESRQVPREINFLAISEKILNREEPGGFEVLNLGVAGWSTDTVLNYYQQEGHKLKPDVMVFSLFVGNDLVETDLKTFRYLFRFAWDCRRYNKPSWAYREGQLRRINFPAWSNVIARWSSVHLYTHSRAFRWSYQKWNRFMERRLNGSQLLRARGISYNDYMERGKGNAYYYRLTDDLIALMAQEAERTQCRFGVLLVPNFPLFYPCQEKDESSKRYVEYQRDLAHYRHMHEVLSTRFPVLDLLGPLQEHSGRGEAIAFQPHDPHFNPAGHLIAGEQLAAFIRSIL